MSTRTIFQQALAMYKKEIDFDISLPVFNIKKASPLQDFLVSWRLHRGGDLPPQPKRLKFVKMIICRWEQREADEGRPVFFVVSELRRIAFPLEELSTTREVVFSPLPHLLGRGSILEYGHNRPPRPVNRVRFLLELNNPNEDELGKLQFIDYQPRSF